MASLTVLERNDNLVEMTQTKVVWCNFESKGISFWPDVDADCIPIKVNGCYNT